MGGCVGRKRGGRVGGGGGQSALFSLVTRVL